MLGTILIIFWIICISSVIYIIKNYSFIKQKIKENMFFKGIVFSIIMIILVLLISLAIAYGIFALNNFGIINYNYFIE